MKGARFYAYQVVIGVDREPFDWTGDRRLRYEPRKVEGRDTEATR
jgi:hypothetical protein